MTACGDADSPVSLGLEPEGIPRLASHNGGNPVVAIDSFTFPAPSGPDALQDFDINDAGDIVAGRSWLRAVGDVITFSQIIQTRTMAVNDLGEVLVWYWDSAGYEWSVATSGNPSRRQDEFIPLGMNDHAQVIGLELRENFEYGAALRDWDSDSFTNLHAQIAAALSFDSERGVTRPTGINNAGHVVGSFLADPLGPEIAFVWRNGTVMSLGPLGGAQSYANDINDAGQIVGSREMADGTLRAFRWQSGRLTDLGTLGGGSSVATSINASGQIVGHSTTATGETHAFIWHRGVMYDLGLPEGATAGEAHDINNVGEVVGKTSPSGAHTGRIWTVAFGPNEPPVEVNLLVSHGQGHAPINRRSNSPFSVTVLGGHTLDVRTIDLPSATLGDGQGLEASAVLKPNGSFQTTYRDVNRDGHLDLAIAFPVQALVANGDLPPTATELIFNGELLEGISIRGSVSVRTVR